MSSRASRASARKISTSISKIAVDDLADSDEETTDVDATLVVDDEKYEVGDKEDEQEEEESSQENNDDEEEFDGESEGGSDEHSGGSDDEDEVIVVPAKRKYKSSKTAVSDDEVVAKKRKTKSQTAEEPPREIEYKVLLFTAAQMKLKKSTRGAPVTEIVTLKSNETWPALRTYILAKINSTLKPAQLLFSNYTVTFTVPRQVSDPIHLNDEDKYEYLVKKALLIVKNPNAKIMVEPKIEQKENEMHVDETDAASKPKSGGKKTKSYIGSKGP
ncbi:hypothetical protein B0H16DRAFT_1485009 [Mycena metata]|uniref:Uncharacterized protein n=1 Tax=Mycena metata TaxID=1033252 RepID=A0AAD7DRD3_9AGAR|nr:hypothetical protein B0H16DRAFT_1485009 [Mycena metata]